MSAGPAREHWESVHGRGRPEERSWFQPGGEPSLTLIRDTGTAPDAPIADVGGGSGEFAQTLLAAGYLDLVVVDLAQSALDAARLRAGPDAGRIRWIRADARTWRPDRPLAVWHDRAVLHFLTDPADRAAYAAAAAAAVAPGGHLVVATFAPDGPERCSGLAVHRMDAAMLAEAFAPAFQPVRALRHEHLTPRGAVQPFTYLLLRRLPRSPDTPDRPPRAPGDPAAP
jgi:SAM-dependent methyltransferase